VPAIALGLGGTVGKAAHEDSATPITRIARTKFDHMISLLAELQCAFGDHLFR
jgi:hypothetical protein